MPGPFPSGSYSAAGKLVEDPERGGMNFVADPGSWADPEPMDTEAITEVPVPEELTEPNPELKEATETAHHVHELTDGVTEDLDGSKELHDALEHSSTEAHGPGTPNNQQELHSAGAHMGETRMADNMGMDAWHPTADTTGVLFAAVAAAAAASALHGIFKKEEPGETPREPAPEAQVQPDHPGGTAEAPPPADPAITAPVAEEPARAAGSGRRAARTARLRCRSRGGAGGAGGAGRHGRRGRSGVWCGKSGSAAG